MDRTDTVAWVVSVCAVYLRLSQAKTLGNLVAAAVRCRRASLADIGRQMLGAAKHQIKRCWRFCSNDLQRPGGDRRRHARGGQKPAQETKEAPANRPGLGGHQRIPDADGLCRAQGPLGPAVLGQLQGPRLRGHKSRNAFEESLLLVLRSMIPQGMKVIILADRGFGRTELARFCQNQGFEYVIRICPKVHVRCASYNGKLLDYPVHKGICKLLKGVDYRQHNSVNQNIVVRWVRGLPAKRDECWFLMSSLEGGPAQISKLYGRRMTIEQFFRDAKNKRNGWSLRDTRLSAPDRLDRMLLILAIAYLLLCGLGLIARKRHKPSAWCSASKDQCSIFLIGLIMLRKLKASPPQAFAAIFDLSEEVAANWG